jgi:peptidoglycan/xylan/chitin deacetylase (PgdA/CDA1 family)
VPEDFIDAYQWNLRGQHLVRPAAFREWPNGARLAVVIIILNEWQSFPWHRDRAMPANSHHKFDFLGLGGREYGAKHGVWRLLDVLDAAGVKSTMVTSGLLAELFPESVRVGHQSGHEIATHQWDQSVHPPTFKSRDEERASLIKSMEALQKVTGEPVRGYMSPGPRPTPHTLDLLAELDFRWTCDYVDSDIPSIITVGGKQVVSVGYSTPGCVDSQLLEHGAVGGLAEIKYAFDAMYEESKKHPLKFCYAVHAHWGGTPSMGRLLADFLDHAKSRDGVWFARCIDVADFWSTRFGRPS